LDIAQIIGGDDDSLSMFHFKNRWTWSDLGASSFLIGQYELDKVLDREGFGPYCWRRSKVPSILYMYCCVISGFFINYRSLEIRSFFGTNLGLPDNTE